MVVSVLDLGRFAFPFDQRGEMLFGEGGRKTTGMDLMDLFSALLFGYGYLKDDDCGGVGGG